MSCHQGASSFREVFSRRPLGGGLQGARTSRNPPPSGRRLLLAILLFASPLTAQSPAAVRALDAAVNAGIQQRTYPGAVVIVGRADTILFAKGYGQYSWNLDTRRPDPAWSLWDVASLSKVVATASAVAVLVGRGLLDLDLPVSSVLPRFSGGGKEGVTIRMLLDHSSGLPAWAPLGAADGSVGSAEAKLFDIPLRRAPGETALYSDLNAILAAMVVEKVSGLSFDEFTREMVFLPSEMAATTWKPMVSDQTRTVPSERRADGSVLVGSVHDPNARALGGIAGHAGVFASGLDLAHFAQRWLRGLAGDSTWVSPDVLKLFAARTRAAGTRALGWDTPLLEPGDGEPPLYGACATDTTIGHTGFTGTLLWLDPPKDLFVVFLTNRSFAPTKRSLSEMRTHRAAVSDAARRLAGERC